MPVAHGQVVGCLYFILKSPDKQRRGSVVVVMASSKFVGFAIVFIVTALPLVSLAPTKKLPPFILGMCSMLRNEALFIM